LSPEESVDLGGYVQLFSTSDNFFAKISVDKLIDHHWLINLSHEHEYLWDVIPPLGHVEVETIPGMIPDANGEWVFLWIYPGIKVTVNSGQIVEAYELEICINNYCSTDSTVSGYVTDILYLDNSEPEFIPDLLLKVGMKTFLNIVILLLKYYLMPARRL